MKKILVILLVASLCFTLVACGGESVDVDVDETSNVSDNSEEVLNEEVVIEETEEANAETEISTETIAITIDNWQDYFEIRILVDPRTNDFNEIDSMFLSAYLVLKDDYAVKYVSTDGALEVKKGGQNTTAVEYNMETEELTLVHSDDVSDRERTETVSLDGYEENGLYLMIGNGTNPDTLEQNGNILTATSQFYKFIEITRIEGNLCLTK